MATAMSDDVGITFHKGLSEWWSEETEYVFQRIERWAAYARGYNRLRSQRLSRGRMTMQEEQEPRWRISCNKLVIDDNSWSPRFHALKKSRRRSRPEESRLNCCGALNYQSNSNLDSSCLETYRYDHSIYFKTIGDIRSGKKNRSGRMQEEDRVSISSEELVEWDAEAAAEFIAEHFRTNVLANDNDKASDDCEERDLGEKDSSGLEVWPVVDFKQLDINTNDITDSTVQYSDSEQNINTAYDAIGETLQVEDNNNNNNNNNNSNNNNNNTNFRNSENESLLNNNIMDIPEERTEQMQTTKQKCDNAQRELLAMNINAEVN